MLTFIKVKSFLNQLFFSSMVLCIANTASALTITNTNKAEQWNWDDYRYDYMWVEVWRPEDGQCKYDNTDYRLVAGDFWYNFGFSTQFLVDNRPSTLCVKTNFRLNEYSWGMFSNIANLCISYIIDKGGYVQIGHTPPLC